MRVGILLALFDFFLMTEAVFATDAATGVSLVFLASLSWALVPLLNGRSRVQQKDDLNFAPQTVFQ
jgi:hypothetical protein